MVKNILHEVLDFSDVYYVY